MSTETRATTDLIVGRVQERARVEQLLSGSAAGHGGALVIRGAPGVGKTTLLRAGMASATGHQVVAMRAADAESGLVYSALQLLCTHIEADVLHLDAHLREVLDTALGRRPGSPPDRFLVGVAMAAALRLVATTKPVLCVIDDAHWLDNGSADVLAFVARRLSGTPIALVIATHEDSFAGLPEVRLAGMAQADARDLFRSALRAPIDDAVAARIVAETDGHPGALVQGALRVSPIEMAGGYGVSRSVDEDETVAGLGRDSRLLLLVAAAEPLGEPLRVWRAASLLGVDGGAVDQLESRRLVSFGARVTFRDPGLRSVVYGMATVAERRKAHAALAAATNHVTEPDRHIWHRARSLAMPDDAVGDELVRCVEMARDRGGLAAAAAFLELAALCTATPTVRAERAIEAADLCHTAGATERAIQLVGTAELAPLDDGQAARLDRIRARIEFDTTRGPAAIAGLMRSAEALEQPEPRLAQETYLEAMAAAIFTGRGDVIETALARLADHQPRSTSRLLDGVAQRSIGGYAAAVEPLKLALKTLDSDHRADTRSVLLACMVAADLWDDDAWHDLTRTELERARNAGALTNLPYLLTHRALVDVLTGDFRTAGNLVSESRVLTDTLGTLEFGQGAAVLAAWRGQRRATSARCHPPRNAGQGMAAVMSGYAEAVLGNGTGAYADALAATRHTIERDGPELQGWSLVEYIEAAVRLGDRRSAYRAFDKLSEQTCLSGTDWALGVEARSRALIEEDGQAEAWYAEAIERLGRCRITTYLARTRLVYGEWLRRQGRRVDARTQLHAAHALFADMGADAFAERAMREFLATGPRARRRVAETRLDLTPQETRIATLARVGRTNPEIATTLSISARTVEYHLHKVYAKLGINFRTELALALPEASSSR